MICHDRKAIFIHIPRNAGRSMEAYIGQKRPQNPHHNGLKILESIKNGEFAEYFTFAIIRNPFDRLVSTFHYYTEGGNGSIADRKIQKELSRMGFYSFIKHLSSLADIIPGYHQELYPFILEQRDYICDQDDNILLDHIIPYESIEQHISYIGKKLGIQRDFPHKNRSQHDNYKDYYDPELMFIIAQKYCKDIELFYPQLSIAHGRI